MSRAIDAVQALNNINRHHRPTPVSQFDSGFNQGLNQAMWEITHASTLTPPNEWVSVEERLPNPKQNVLAYSPKSGIAEADYADGVWMQYRWSAVMDGVTHWMLLPNLPDRRPPERQEDT